MTHLTRQAIDLTALVAQVSDPSLGGTAVFLGSVRRGGDDGPIRVIEYSAHEELLDEEFGKIADETQARWPGTRIAVVHRLGQIAPGEPSIAVVAAAPHRADAFAACRHAIEEAKKRLPVWKKEIFDDGTELWRQNEPPGEAPAPAD